MTKAEGGETTNQPWGGGGGKGKKERGKNNGSAYPQIRGPPQAGESV